MLVRLGKPLCRWIKWREITPCSGVGGCKLGADWRCGGAPFLSAGVCVCPHHRSVQKNCVLSERRAAAGATRGLNSDPQRMWVCDMARRQDSRLWGRGAWFCLGLFGCVFGAKACKNLRLPSLPSGALGSWKVCCFCCFFQ